MWTILKLIMVVFIGGFAFIYALDKIPSLKAQIVEFTNPAIKEDRLLGELESSHDQIEDVISQDQNLTPEAKKVLTEKITEIKNKTEEIKNTNKKETSLPTKALQEISNVFLNNETPIIERIKNIYTNNTTTKVTQTDNSPTPIPSPCQ